MKLEAWRAVVGFEGYYEVSDLGRVRSLDRVRTTPHAGPRQFRGQIRSLAQAGPYLQVTLKVDGQRFGRRVHVLVAEAFLGPRPVGMEVCHTNGNPIDNRLVNLRYDTSAGNKRDTIQQGRHHQLRKTHCPRGHAYTPDNLTPNSTERRRACLTCQRERRKSSRKVARHP